MSGHAPQAIVVGGDTGGRVTLITTTGFMVAGILLFFILFVFAFFLFLRTKHYWGTIPGFGRALSGGFSDAVEVPSGVRRQGLDRAAVKALASFTFRSEDFPEGVECAVCLSELSGGEAVLRLPKCGHGFHLECIDMWFRSHSNCPVCRCPVIADLPRNAGSGGAEIVEVESREAAATGDENPIGTSSSQIPAATTTPAQQEESIANPSSSLSNSRWIPAIVIAWLPASMRRFLMHGRGQRVTDLEQGGGSHSGPKTPPPPPANS